MTEPKETEVCPRCKKNADFIREIKGYNDYQYITQWQYFCSHCNNPFSVEVERTDRPNGEIVQPW